MARVLACLMALFLIPLSTSAQIESGVVVGFSQGPPNAPPARDARPATGRSTIRGHIVAADNGQPGGGATGGITAPAPAQRSPPPLGGIGRGRRRRVRPRPDARH